MSIRTVLVGVALALLVVPATAGSLKVPQDFATIQEAIDAAGDGDKVIVSAGDYAERVMITDRQEFTLKFKSGARLVTGGSGDAADGEAVDPGVVVEGSDLVLLAGVVVEGTASTGILLSDCSFAAARKCSVSGAGTAGIDVVNSTFILFKKCSVSGALDAGIRTDATTAFVVLIGNLVEGGPGTGIRDMAIGSLIKKSKVHDATDTGIETATGELERNKVFDAVQTGILATGAATITRCSVERAQLPGDGKELTSGIRCTGDGAIVKSSSVSGWLTSGIRAEGAGTLVQKCKVTGVEGLEMDGLVVSGTQSTATSNRIIDANEGIQLSGSGHVITKNKVIDAQEDGLDVECSGSEISRNKVSNAVDDGLCFESATGNTVERNKVKGSGGNGIEVDADATGNTFTKNSAKGSGGLDLEDLTRAGANTYVDNKFATSNIGL